MKFLVLALAMSLSALSFAETKMGPEALEMFRVMNHAQVQECLRNENMNLINLEIKKTVFRCPGCTTYTITGNELGIDIPRPEKTVITIKGKSVPGTFGGFIQTYTCSVKN